MLPAGVTSTQWESARQIAIARSGGVCAICHQPLQPNARPRSRMSTEVDHKIPLDAVAHLSPDMQRYYALDQSNLQVVHKFENARKAARQPLQPGTLTSVPYEPRVQSQDW